MLRVHVRTVVALVMAIHSTTAIAQSSVNTTPVLLIEQSGKAALFIDGQLIGTADRFQLSPAIERSGVKQKPKPDRARGLAIERGRANSEAIPSGPAPPPKPDPGCSGPFCPGGTPIFSKDIDPLIQYDPRQEELKIYRVKNGVLRELQSEAARKLQ